MGCGTGLLFEHLIKLILENPVIKINYIALDISWKMLLEFRSKLKQLKKKRIYPNLILTDIEFLPFRKNIFSSVFSLTAFQNLPHIQEGIHELYRVSKHNADFKFSILKKKSDLNIILETLKPIIKDLEVIVRENLEDFILEGNVVKIRAF